jgi:ATP-binding cassette subfamily B protein
MPKIKGTDKPKNRKRTLLQLLRYLLDFKWLLILALLLTVAGNLLALVGPLLSGYAIDAIAPGPGRVDFNKVFLYVALMAAFFIVSAVLSYLLKILMVSISRNLARRMRKDVFDKMLILPVGYFDTHQTGDLISRISYDIDTVNSSLSGDLVMVASAAVSVVGALVMMISLSPPLMMIFVVTVPLSVLWSRFLVKTTRPLFRERSRRLGELNGYSEEMITCHKTILAYDMEETVTGHFNTKNKAAVDAFYDAEYYGSMMGPAVNFINNVSLSLIILFGALLFMGGGITIGRISSFLLYSRRFSGPINEIANTVGELQSALAAAERIFELLSQPIETPDAAGAQPLAEIDGRVGFDHVSFSYTPGTPVISDLSFQADAGRLIAIVGPTGAGKTTIVNLLMRFYNVDAGSITIDGNALGSLTRDSVRRAFSMVLQDTWLFHGTILENIVYGKSGAALEDAVSAAKAAGIHNFIMRLPKGYDTLVSNEDTVISKGQKQLLTIARAMLLDTNMLILDEATSNVDTRTELKIQKAMRRLMENKTCFVIAHRLSTIRGADTILVVDKGDIVEQGSHDALIRAGGRYAALYQAQFE